MSFLKYRNTKLKIEYLKNRIYFLKQCRKLGIFPNFIQNNISIVCTDQNTAVHVANRAKSVWLNKELNRAYKNKQTLEEKMYYTHVSMSSVEYEINREKCYYFINKSAEEHRNRLNKKCRT